MTAIATEATIPRETVVVQPKHHALVRFSHWLNVPLLAGLIASGLSIYWAAPVFQHAPDPITHSSDYLADAGIWMARHLGVPPGPRDRFWFYEHFSTGVFGLATALRLHWLFAYLFMTNGVLYILGLIVGRGYRALRPRRGQLREAAAMQRYYAGVVPMKLLRKPWPHPEVRGKYNALQRSAYLAMPVAGLLLVLSGWAMHKPAQLGWLERLFVNYNGARITHFVSMVLIIALVIPHVVLVFLDGWDTLRSMITGWSLRIRGERGE